MDVKESIEERVLMNQLAGNRTVIPCIVNGRMFTLASNHGGGYTLSNHHILRENRPGKKTDLVNHIAWQLSLDKSLKRIDTFLPDVQAVMCEVNKRNICGNVYIDTYTYVSNAS